MLACALYGTVRSRAPFSCAILFQTSLSLPFISLNQTASVRARTSISWPSICDPLRAISSEFRRFKPLAVLYPAALPKRCDNGRTLQGSPVGGHDKRQFGSNVVFRDWPLATSELELEEGGVSAVVDYRPPWIFRQPRTDFRCSHSSATARARGCTAKAGDLPVLA